MILQELIHTVQVDILAAECKKVDTWWNFNKINSPFSRLFYILKGQAQVRHHNQTFTLTPGSFHLIPCFSNCDYSCNQSFEHYSILFTAGMEGGIDLFEAQQYDYHITDAASELSVIKRLVEINPGKELINADPSIPIFKRVSKKVSDPSIHDDPAVILESSILLQQLFIPFIRTAVKHKSQNEEIKLNTVLKYIDKNLNQKLSLDMLAKKIDLSPNYFSELFIKSLDIRPSQYLIKKRIEKAQILLITTNKAIKKIAYETGFNDVCYFSRLFKKLVKLTPTDYRQGKSAQR